MESRMPQDDLERAYDLIAVAIDRAGREQESAFLSRLCLALAAQLDNSGQVQAAIEAAEKARQE